MCGALGKPIFIAMLSNQDALDDFRCPIRFSLMLQPVRLSGCSARHVFCRTCISLWFESSGASAGGRTCPIDGRAVPADEELQPDAHNEAAMRKLLVRCTNSRAGCGSLVSLDEHAAHLGVCA